MNSIAVLGAGAFGTALAISLAKTGKPVTLWARTGGAQMQAERENTRRLAGVRLPDTLMISDGLETISAQTWLLAVPMQQLGQFCHQNVDLLRGRDLVACCKGIDLATQLGPVALMRRIIPDATHAVLSGPSFAVDIAANLPTALTLASPEPKDAQRLRDLLSTQNIRLYSSVDCTGVELGGALKNVIAIAAGLAIGAGLGDSARAALMTRGFAEVTRLAQHLGADPATLAGLSGFGDLVLTCTSQKSRNFTLGLALGAGEKMPDHITVEGVATAKAVSNMAQSAQIDLPIVHMIAAILDRKATVAQAMDALLSRPLKPE
ncbi:Glycerol-3-phosphate dehydrogenase [NAD(P)+] [Aquimixticola soesokkakensis]|uniref:Glycerol-3-phosphate dehydrogenase [NAD(P)+] n=1 Tax=Aquimixticola soesokkakensis TaxID=1519096 RepID=A0A1Y5R9Z9_9RHOB|nr:NAD(P)H-dependent glycerol-3-phosphate dehydrogenase [Aquimixticola soesokkakensis]SLN12248.1 Glycerol-3-phosphate dehydrogenase [NAD(P)+] [Aquimixticola soesokkakensis]